MDSTFVKCFRNGVKQALTTGLAGSIKAGFANEFRLEVVSGNGLGIEGETEKCHIRQ